MLRGRIAALIAMSLVLAGCDVFDWFEGPTKAPLPGERIAVIAESRAIEPDTRISDVRVTLPEAVANPNWPQPGGSPGHAMQVLAGGGFETAWRSSAGSGASRNGRITSAPVVVAGRVYTLDAGAQLSAFDAATGSTLWRIEVNPENDDSGGTGGGVAFDNGRLYVSTGFAQVLALDADSGKEIWRQNVTAPIRGGPTVGGGRVYVISADNQTHALDAESGRKLWSHSGITESAGIYGGSSPALAGNVVLSAYSSGELFALRGDNGRVLWAESLAGALRADAVSALADIRGFPVVDRGVVYVASHSGRIAAIDLRSGGRIWEQNFGSLYTPWVAGEFLFVTTVDGEVVCLLRRDGRVRWVRKLQHYRDEKNKRGVVVWTGPVLAGDKLFVVSSEGQGVLLSPQSGEIVSQRGLPSAVSVTPIVADRTVYVLTDSAALLALR